MPETTEQVCAALNPRLVESIKHAAGMDNSPVLKPQEYDVALQGLLRLHLRTLTRMAAQELELRTKYVEANDKHQALVEQLKKIDVNKLTDDQVEGPEGLRDTQEKINTMRKILATDVFPNLRSYCQDMDEKMMEAHDLFVEQHEDSRQLLEEAVDEVMRDKHPKITVTEEHKTPLYFTTIEQVRDLCETLRIKPKQLPVSLEDASIKASEFAKLQVFLTVYCALDRVEFSG